jgi:hypothetical protein
VLGPRIFATVVVAGLMALLAGCGGSSGVSPAAYAKSVCTAIGPFEQKLLSANSLNLSRSNAGQGKKALQGFLSSVAGDTDRAVSQLKSAGTPNVSNGKAISGAIVNAFTQMRGAFKQAVSQAGSLPTSSPKLFRTAAAQLGLGVSSSVASIRTSLNGLKSATLDQATRSTSACQRLGL